MSNALSDLAIKTRQIEDVPSHAPLPSEEDVRASLGQQLSGIEATDPSAELRDRGPVSEPTGISQPTPEPIRDNIMVSDLVAEQQR
jgi:hypothetical protein